MPWKGQVSRSTDYGGVTDEEFFLSAEVQHVFHLFCVVVGVVELDQFVELGYVYSETHGKSIYYKLQVPN